MIFNVVWSVGKHSHSITTSFHSVVAMNKKKISIRLHKIRSVALASILFLILHKKISKNTVNFVCVC